MKLLMSQEIRRRIVEKLFAALDRAAQTGSSHETIRLAKYLLHLADKFDDFYVGIISESENKEAKDPPNYS